MDDALGLTATAASALAEGRRGKNIRHHSLGLLRQAVYGRLAGYEDVNVRRSLRRSRRRKTSPFIKHCASSKAMMDDPRTKRMPAFGLWCRGTAEGSAK